jgi:hypothetical protein
VNSSSTQTVPIADRPAFLLGVSGVMSLNEKQAEAFQKRFRLLLYLLRCGGKAIVAETSKTLSDTWVELLTTNNTAPEYCERLRHTFNAWPGLQRTPIVLMCNLAPGIDTLAVHVAREAEFSTGDNPIQFKFPLPFPHCKKPWDAAAALTEDDNLYRTATTFVRKVVPDQDLQRQNEYEKILKEIGLGKAFAVRTAADVRKFDSTARRIWPTTLERCWANFEQDLQPDARDGRYARYYAAGEYLATHCHLLVAVWDGTLDGSLCGTSRVAKARLFGPEPNVQAATSEPILPHGGPLLHFFMQATELRQAAEEVSPASLEMPDARFLYPFEQRSDAHSKAAHTAVPNEVHASDQDHPLLAASQHLDCDLQEDRLALLIRTINNLETFNVDAEQMGEDDSKFAQNVEEELNARLVYKETTNKVSIIAEVRQKCPAMIDGLRRLTSLRTAARLTSASLKTPNRKILRHMFMCTFVAAVLLHMVSFWPKNNKPSHPADSAIHNHEHANLENSTADQTAHVDVSKLPVEWAHCLASVFALALAFVALLLFGETRARQWVERDHDARSIAEGVRVQVAWCMAGIGASVSANYLQRHRSELDWCRAAIRSLAFPYGHWIDWFHSLDRPLQWKMLKAVQHTWVASQAMYFGKEFREKYKLLHNWHLRGTVAALAGLFVQIILWMEHLWPSLYSWIHHHSLSCIVIGFGCFMMMIITGAIKTLIQEWKEYDGSHPAGSESMKHSYSRIWNKAMHCLTSTLPFPFEMEKKTGVDSKRQKIICNCKLFDRMVEWLNATHRHGPELPNFGSGFAGGIRQFSVKLPGTFGIALIVFGFAGSLEHFDLTRSNAGHALAHIVSGTLLIAGALSIAWSEKSLYSEHAYQYQTMEGLFLHTNARLETELAGLKKLTSAATSAEIEAYNKQLRMIQDILLGLGQEALDENAEWLILHRARPLEPVMAG